MCKLTFCLLCCDKNWILFLFVFIAYCSWVEQEFVFDATNWHFHPHTRTALTVWSVNLQVSLAYRICLLNVSPNNFSELLIPYPKVADNQRWNQEKVCITAIKIMQYNATNDSPLNRMVRFSHFRRSAVNRSWDRTI